MMTKPILYLLVGAPGSGKSTYASEALSDASRVSQDLSGPKQHWRIFNDYVIQRKDIVLDRMNFSLLQRQRYITLAKKHGYEVRIIFFDADKHFCLERLENRLTHETISINDDCEAILEYYFCNFQPIQSHEYDKLVTLKMRKYAQILDLREQIGNQRFIVVGDIHGCFDEFMALLNEFQYKTGDIVISCGDLVDRGDKIRETLEWFMNTPNAYVVEGNHDNKAKRYWKGNKVKIADGLAKTIDQCKDMNAANLVAWMESWPQIIQLPDISGKPTYVVHAGLDDAYPIQQQLIEVCLYMRFVGKKDFYRTHFGGRDVTQKLDDEMWYEQWNGSANVMCGHIIHDIATPRPDIYCLDGGAFKGLALRGILVENGHITIIEVPSLPYYVSPRQIQIDDAELSNNPIAARDNLVQSGMLRSDDLDSLRIYTYSTACEHQKSWNSITLNSRGIIINRDTSEIVAQPFSKFFNLNETEATFENNLPWDEPYQVFEKLDGWLGILYRHEGKHLVATRGSFKSEGAIWASDYLNRNYNLQDLPNEVTLLFEIICPITHIIVDYAGREDLVLLAAFNRHTGTEYDWEQVSQWAKQFGFNTAQVVESNLAKCKQLVDIYRGNENEGFVIRFQNGTRVKLKASDYLRRASLLAHMSPLSIWELMIDGVIGQDVINQIDPDYQHLFNAIYENLQSRYRDIKQEIFTEFAQFDKIDRTNRKMIAQAIIASSCKHKPMMFALIDNKGDCLDKYIKKQIRPTDNKMV